MSDMTIRNMQLVRAALDKEEIRYFTSPTSVIAYMPCKTNLKNGHLRPTSLRVTVTPGDTGVLFECDLPIALQAAREEECQTILREIAKENYGTIRGCLIYIPESQRLQYRIFSAVGEDASGFDAKEVVACVRLSAAGLSDGYEIIVNAWGSVSGDKETKDAKDTPEGLAAELEKLFEQMFASSENASQPAQEEALEGIETLIEASDALSDDSTPVEAGLRSLLDEFLSDDADTE